MASSDKNKAGTLIKSEFGEIRQDCTDTYEASKHHTFAEIGDQPFHKLFPKSYDITNIQGSDAFVPMGDTPTPAEIAAMQTSLMDSNISRFVSDIIAECTWTIEDNTTFGTASVAPRSTYNVTLDCTRVPDRAMRRLIESKASKYVLKEFDTYGVLDTANDDGNITFRGLVR
jgi:hypothetical protein